MPTFFYSALDAAGSPRRGEVVFPSRIAAIESLTQLGLILVEIREQHARDIITQRLARPPPEVSVATQ